MRFDDRLLDDIRARIPPSKLIGRSVNLTRAGGSYKALSPFNKEKTPSFYVNDDKQIFKDFSSGLGGDIFKWLMLTEGLSFPEAVERLAAEAGIAMPERDPETAARQARTRGLSDWLEAAQGFYAQALRSPAGAEARAYLIRRGVPETDWARFEIGYAPEGWTNLSKHLAKLGAKPADLLAAGLVRASTKEGREPYDYFRNRITFAIRNPSKHLVGFGGRALAKDEKAKYINSPESELFKKGELLYRFPEARGAAAHSGKDAARRGLVIVEGYMDAIALAQAGVEETVASLGTALTPEQIELAWRAGPRPVLLLDGDEAGIAAGYRVLDRVMPKLEPGRTMRFARLEGGKDPDDLVRSEGIDGARRVIGGAIGLDELLWERAVQSFPVFSPDDAAQLENELKSQIEKIEHGGVRAHYRAELLAKFNAAYGYRARMRRDGNKSGRPGTAGGGFSAALPVTRQRRNAEQNAIMNDIRRLLHAVLERPALIEHVAEALADLEIPDPALAELRDALVDAGEREETIDKLSLERHLETFGADLTANWVRDGFTRAEAPVLLRDHWSDADALTAWKREAALHHQRRSRPDERRDLKDAALAGVDANDREHERRFAAAARGLTAAEEEVAAAGDGGEAARERFDAAIGALEAAHARKKGKRRA